MATDIKVPAVGESITEGTISRWIKKDKEPVRAEEPLFELETEKATTEVPATTSGIVRISVPEGSTVPIGSVIGRIEEGSVSQPAKRDGPRPVVTPAKEPQKSDGKSVAAKAPAPTEPKEQPLLSPAARRLAQEKQVNIQELTGTGPAGRVTKEDVLSHLEQHQKRAGEPAAKRSEPAAPPPSETTVPTAESRAPSNSRETRQRMTSIRQRISEKLLSAQNTAAILTTFNEADLSAVTALRARYKDTFKARHGVNLGFMSFFVKAVIEALRAFPVVNAWIDGTDIVYHHYYNIGVAVSTERGLMVPVLRDADRLSFADIEKRIAEVAQKARDGKITVDDLQGGTFTITNGGIFGSLLSTPILNPPQSAILGMHAIQKRPVAIDDQVVIRPMMYLALSYDHRLIDGREAVQFLVRVKECIENPERMFLEI